MPTYMMFAQPIAVLIVAMLWAMWHAWRQRRRDRRWDTAIYRLGIPADVAARMEKADPEHHHPPDWYAGRTR